MFIPLRYLALGYRVIAAAIIFTGIGRITGLFDGDLSGAQFTYYTVLSNILCLVWMVVLVIATIRDLRSDGMRGWSTPSPRFGGAVMEAITVTTLVYLFVLVPTTFTQGDGGYVPFTLTDNLVHIVSGCLIVGDWLLFTPKGKLRWIDPILWAAIPYAYLVFAFTWGAFGGTFGAGRRYPYPFMNVETLGVGGVAIWILGLTVVLVAVGYIYVAIDRGLGWVAKARQGRLDPQAPAHTSQSAVGAGA